MKALLRSLVLLKTIMLKGQKIVDISQFDGSFVKRAASDKDDPLILLHLATVSLFIFNAYVSFAGDTLLNYVLSLYFVYFFIISFDRISPLISGTWFLFLFPGWALLSVLWAELPLVAAKSAVYLFLTGVICYLIVLWFSEKMFVQIMLWALFPAVILSHIFMKHHGDGAIGVFGSKNQLGFAMTILIIASVFTLLEKDAGLIPKVASIIALPLAIPLLLASNSATAIVVALMALCLACALYVFTSKGTLFSSFKIALLLFGFGVTALISASVFATMQVNPVEIILQALGKDSTLTGRTELWDYAKSVIAQRPFFGVGEGGFWRYTDNPLVQRIFEEYHKSPRQGFSFHNAYYEIAVHQGLIGLGLAVVTIVWCTLRIASLALLSGGMGYGFIFTTIVVLLARTPIEIGLIGPFLIITIVAYCGAIYYQKQQK